MALINRTSFPEGASSLPLRDIPPKRQLKPQTNKEKTNYFLTNHQRRKTFLKTAISQRTIIFLSLFSLHLLISPFTKTNHQNVKTTTSHHTIILLPTVQFAFVQFYISSMFANIFSIPKSNQKCV